MNTFKPHLITTEGLRKLTEELEHMKTVGREEVADRLHRAFEDGQDADFVDNAELEAARNAQSFLEGRIQELEGILKNYQIIDDNGEPHDKVRVGDYVTVSEEGVDEDERYHLVGAAEADPAEGRISNESPLGKALLGSKVGEVVRFDAP
ncbi:MAG: transcription elongation factor GreA, partial [Anaerolineae bacterium]